MTELAKCETFASSPPTITTNHRNYRFVSTSIPDVKTRQSSEASEVKAEIANLEKKLHYLETTYKNSQQHMEALFKRGG